MWPMSPLEEKVLNIIKKYLEGELGKYEGVIDGGIYLKYKPKNIRLKVIELNGTNYNAATSLSQIRFFFVNINYQDEDQELVEEVTEYIYNIMEHSVIRNLFFESNRKEVCKISPYLWLGNNHFEITNNTLYKKTKQNDRIE